MKLALAILCALLIGLVLYRIQRSIDSFDRRVRDDKPGDIYINEFDDSEKFYH